MTFANASQIASLFCMIFVCHVYNSFQNVRQFGEIYIYSSVYSFSLLSVSLLLESVCFVLRSFLLLFSTRFSGPNVESNAYRPTPIFQTEILLILPSLSLPHLLPLSHSLQVLSFNFLRKLYTKSLRTWQFDLIWYHSPIQAKRFATAFIGYCAHPIPICIWNETHKSNQIKLAQYWIKIVDGRVTNSSSCSLHISSSFPRGEHTLACELCDVVKRAQNQIA